MAELFHVDLAAIFSFPPLVASLSFSLSFFLSFFFPLSWRMCWNAPPGPVHTVFHARPLVLLAAAEAARSSLAGVSLQPTRDPPHPHPPHLSLSTSRSHLTAHGTRRSRKIQNPRLRSYSKRTTGCVRPRSSDQTEYDL